MLRFQVRPLAHTKIKMLLYSYLYYTLTIDWIHGKMIFITYTLDGIHKNPRNQISYISGTRYVVEYARTNHRISGGKEQEVEFKPGKKEIRSRGNKRLENSKRVEFKLGEKEV